ncbi:MAG TPA: hypothetical protein VIV84_02385 [Burkholderiaceae bacterium]
MSTSHSTLPRSVNLVHVRAPRTDRSDPGLRGRLERMQALRDPAQWQAAALALMLSPESRRERAVWFDETRDLPDAERLLEDVLALSQPLQLPWLEAFARQLAPGPVEPRHALIGAARRLMTADGIVTQMDQLRWVALRHLLAGSAVAAPAAAETGLAELDDAQALKVCLFSAFLSHMVPAPDLTLDLTGHDSTGQIWYSHVISPWFDRFVLPPRERHDIDATLRALRVLQSMPWLLRPVLVRRWFDAARELTEGPVLHPVAADALRLTCTLLDSPVPPELGRQYIEVEPARH